MAEHLLLGDVALSALFSFSIVPLALLLFIDIMIASSICF